MTEIHTPQIALRDIDTDRLDDTDDNPEAVLFRVRLSETPPPGWAHEFDEIYKQTPYTLKPPVHVNGDALEIVYLPRYAGELDGFLRFLALVVRRSNDELHRTEEIHTSDVHERDKARFREALRRVKMPA